MKVVKEKENKRSPHTLHYNYLIATSLRYCGTNQQATKVIRIHHCRRKFSLPFFKNCFPVRIIPLASEGSLFISLGSKVQLAINFPYGKKAPAPLGSEALLSLHLTKGKQTGRPDALLAAMRSPSPFPSPDPGSRFTWKADRNFCRRAGFFGQQQDPPAE